MWVVSKLWEYRQGYTCFVKHVLFLPIYWIYTWWYNPSTLFRPQQFRASQQRDKHLRLTYTMLWWCPVKLINVTGTHWIGLLAVMSSFEQYQRICARFVSNRSSQHWSAVCDNTQNWHVSSFSTVKHWRSKPSRESV